MAAVPGWPGYAVTDDGVVLSKAGRPLSFYEHYRTHHRRVRLYGPTGHRRGTRGGSFADLYIHQVVCLAFHGAPPFAGALVRHLDGNCHNNHPDNLCWGTHQDNADDYWSDDECVYRRSERAGMRGKHPEYVPDAFLGF